MQVIYQTVAAWRILKNKKKIHSEFVIHTLSPESPTKIRRRRSDVCGWIRSEFGYDVQFNPPVGFCRSLWIHGPVPYPDAMIWQ